MKTYKLGMACAAVAMMLAAACSAGKIDGGLRLSNKASGSGGSGSGDGAGVGGDLNIGGSGPSCTGLKCKQVACEGSATTTVSGTVYAPEGTLPIYNVLVFIPQQDLDPIADGVSCDKCGYVSGDPIVSDVTDTKGHFTLKNVPVADDLKMVIQVGKWRKVIDLPPIQKCADNPITDPKLTSLPGKQGPNVHIPKIALTTGGADVLECLLRKFGLDPSEFTLSNGSGRVNLYAASGGSNQYSGMNNGASIESAIPFWSSLDELKKYDIVVLSCEGSQHMGEKPPQALQAMSDYASLGGRIFMSHWQNGWLQHGPGQWPQTAQWDFQGDPPEPYNGQIDTSFPKGKAFESWLVNVGASPQPGILPIVQPRHTIAGVNPQLSRRWVNGDQQSDNDSVKYYSFTAPIGVSDDKMCGKVVFSDIHVAGGDHPGEPFPEGCVQKGLSPQEKALIFMLFDLSSCIQNDNNPPQPPVK